MLGSVPSQLVSLEECQSRIQSQGARKQLRVYVPLTRSCQSGLVLELELLT